MPPPSLSSLFARWEEALEQGRDLPPEQLCTDRPELAAPLRELIAAAKRAGAPAGLPATTTSDLGATTPPLTPAGSQDAPPGYEVLGELGRGGMGVVFKARQLALNRVVALKMILSGEYAGPSERARFLAEAEAVARVRHPGVVQVFDFGTHAGRSWFSMELCEGGSLAGKLRDGPLPPREAARAVAQVARAVQAAHDAGIVHRDLKPGNVLLARDGTPRVTDFGLAKRAEGGGDTETGAVVGTASYMSPEQAGGRKGVGKPTDVWALGAVLYACLTGRPPFQAATTVETLLQVMGEDPVPPRRLNAAIPKDLETVCLKCLRKEPARRYASAAELADDLGRWLEGRPVVARPVGRLERLASWCRREPVTASLVGSVAAALLVGTAVAWGLASWALGEKGRADLEANGKRQEAKAANLARGEAEAKEKLANERKEAADHQAARAEDAGHALRVDFALRAWERNAVAEAERALGQAIPRLARSWETRYVRALCRRKAIPLVGHAHFVWAGAFSPDGRRVVTGSFDTTVKVWDAETGREVLSLKGHKSAVWGVAFSPDGLRVASAGNDNVVKVWDAQSGREVRSLEGHTAAVRGVCFSPDGAQVASGGQDRIVRVWDAATGREVRCLKGHTHGIHGVCFSPDGRRILSGGGDPANSRRRGELRVWDAESGKEALTLGGGIDTVEAVAYSPDGTRLLSGGVDGLLRVWDARTGRETLSLKGHEGVVAAVAFSPDGQRLASGGLDRAVKVWDAGSGRELVSLEGHDSGVHSVCFSPDGRRVLSTGGDLVNTARLLLGEVLVWDTAAGRETLSLDGHGHRATSVAFSPDGRRIVTGGWDRTARVWDAGTGREVLSLEGHLGPVRSVCFSRDGERILTGSDDRTARVWDARTGRQLLSLAGHAGAGTGTAAYSPDGKRILSAGFGGLRVWDARTGQEVLSLAGAEDSVLSACFSPDGERILTAGTGKVAKVREAGTGREVFTLAGHLFPVNSAAFSPDATRIVTASSDRILKVWDARNGKELFSLVGHRQHVTSVAYSRDGKRILSGGGDVSGSLQTLTREPGELRVWDAATGQLLLSLDGHPACVRCVAFSPDGRRAASGGDGTTLKVWDAGVGHPLRHLKGHAGFVTGVAFSPDGKRVFSKDDRGNRLDFDAETGDPLPAGTTPPPRWQLRADQPDGDLVAVAVGPGVYLVSPAGDAAAERSGQAQADLRWHAAQAAGAAADRRWFAAAFHLQRLRRLDPLDASLRGRLLVALRQCPAHPGTEAVRRRAGEFDRARRAAALLPLAPPLP